MGEILALDFTELVDQPTSEGMGFTNINKIK